MLDEYRDLKLKEDNILAATILYPIPLVLARPESYSALSQQIVESSGWWKNDSLKLGIVQLRNERVKEVEGKNVYIPDTMRTLCLEISLQTGISLDRLEDMTFDQFVDTCVFYEDVSGKQIFPDTSKDPRRKGRGTPSPEPEIPDAIVAHNDLRQRLAQEKTILQQGGKIKKFDWRKDVKGD